MLPANQPIRLGFPFTPDPKKSLENPDCIGNVIVTTALPYVNNHPHLGNIIGSVLSADVGARFERLCGNNCMFIGGTDEYGSATEYKAFQDKKSPKEICDEFFPFHRDSYEWINIDFDIFGRTTNPHHEEITQSIYQDLKKNGYIFEKEGVFTFCLDCNRFLADRFVSGICPKCTSPDGRGDQCDKCGSLLDATELINPKCNYCTSSRIEKRSSVHAFLDLPKLEPLVREAVIPKSLDEALDNKWTSNAYHITKSWLDQGLHARSITRDLSWGIPVPEMIRKVFYVWFDAPIGYLSITQQLLSSLPEQSVSWKDWWIFKSEETRPRLVQFMGKDNASFHCVFFPSMQLGTGHNYVTVNNISTTEYLLYEGGKFSKSRGIGIFGPEMKNFGFHPDLWRFYLLSRRPETSDASFDWKDFESTVNGLLIDQFGNLVLRLQSLYYRNCWSDLAVVQSITCNENLVNECFDLSIISDFIEAMKYFHYRHALKLIFKFIANINRYITVKEPWKLLKTNFAGGIEIIILSLAGLFQATVCLNPFIPEKSIECLNWFGLFQSENIATNIRIHSGWSLISTLQEHGEHSPYPPSALFDKIFLKN